MELFNLLEATIPMFGDTYDVSLNWIGNLIRLLIKGVGSVGFGIILFSLILKLIVLPFDVYQRIGMRKQNQSMKENQEQMEKLQKQYANDKDMYNKKVMELYKKNGLSMCSSCLPMILSLVIFIFAINAFNAYAQYSNVQNYNDMVKAYQSEIGKYTATLSEQNLTWTDTTFTVTDKDGENVYIYYKGNVSEEAKGYTTYEEKANYVENMLLKDKSYYVDEEKVKSNAAIMEQVTALVSEEVTESQAMEKYFIALGQKAVKEAYDTEIKNHTKFFWIKNIWAVDASYKHPILGYSDFQAEAKREKFEVEGAKVKYGKMTVHTEAYTENAYGVITGELGAAKSAANGYFVLIVLSIGTILLQQLVTMRSQKEQQKFSTVDGQGASQQKMMMVMMTGMFAIFSFMYSSAFSIYMITSNVFSLISTLIINKCVDKKLDKRAEKETIEKLDNGHAARIEAAKEAGRKSAQEKKENKNK